MKWGCYHCIVLFVIRYSVIVRLIVSTIFAVIVGVLGEMSEMLVSS